MKGKNKVNFDSFGSLKPVENILNEANEALKDKKRTIVDSPISDVLVGTVGAGVGGAISYATLYAAGSVTGLSGPGIMSGLATVGGIVGCGAAAGVIVLAAPVVAIGGGAVYLNYKRRISKLVKEKHRLLQQSIMKLAALNRELHSQTDKSSERIKYLERLIVLLEDAVAKLKKDLNERNG